MTYFGNMMNMMQNYSGNWSNLQQVFGPMLWAFVTFGILLVLAFWIYTSVAYMDIAKKLKYKKSWLAWIPFARGAMILELGGFHWAFIFLLLIPFAGWLAFAVLTYISTWRIFEKRKYPGWFALIPLAGLIPYISVFASLAFLIILGFVAWSDKKGKK
jgi:hypothetical protein